MGNVSNTEVLDFTNGMNTVVSPHLINKSEARGLVNVNIKQGALASMPTLKLIEQAMDRYFVEFNNIIYYYNTFRTNAYVGNNLYWADGLNTGKILWDGRELDLGIPAPTTPLVIAPGTVGPHTGDFKYTYTFYSTDTGVESAPAPLPLYLTVDKLSIIVSALEPFPMSEDVVPVPLADRYRIYRIGGYLPRFTMVDEIELREIPYTDSLDDTDIDGRLLQTLHSQAPLDGMHDFVELGGRLFGSLGPDLHFSAVGNPDAWYRSDFYRFPDDITGTAKSPAGILVFGESYTYLLVGTAPQNFRLKVISNVLGCVARESIAYLNEQVLWLSETGICTSNGYTIKNLTADKIENISALTATSAIVINEVYYLAFKPSIFPSDELFPSDDLLPAGAKGTGVLEEGIITMDFKRGQGYSYSLYDYGNIASIGNVNGEISIVTATPTIFLDCSLPLECDRFIQCSQYELNSLGKYKENKLAKLFYISPQFIDGTFATLKEYEKIRINFVGEFKIVVIFSDGTVAIDTSISTTLDTKEIITSDGVVLAFEQESVEILGIQNGDNKSYSIAFIIEGYGSVKSIQYSWKPRELA